MGIFDVCLAEKRSINERGCAESVVGGGDDDDVVDCDGFKLSGELFKPMKNTIT